MSQLPANVSYFMSRLQGVSTSHFKIFPQSDGIHTSGKIIRFELPSNSLVNFNSIRMLMNASCVGAGTGGRLPNKIDSLISNVAVYMGGVLVGNNFNGYNVLRHAKDAVMGDRCNPTLGHPEIVRAKSYHNGQAITTTDPEADDDKDKQYAIDMFEGLLGSIQPSIIDTGLLPQITIEITLAEDSVCPSVSGVALAVGNGTGASGTIDKASTTATTYKLEHVSLQVEVLNMASSVLDQITEQRIASVGYLSLPFKNYFTYQSTHEGTSRFNVNSASWDRLWVTYRPTNYATSKGAVPVNGYKIQGFFGDDAAGQTAADIDVGKPTYDLGGVLDTNKEKYISNYFNFKESKTDAANPAYYQLQVNSASVPAYRMTASDALAMTQNSLDGRKNYALSLDQAVNNYHVHCYRFCLPESDFNRSATGLDSRSVSAQGALETTNLATTSVMMFAECTSELRVGKYLPCQQEVLVGA